MKKSLMTAAILLVALAELCAQAPEAFQYQAVARDASGDVLTDQNVGISFQIHQNTAGGTVVYAETHNPITNAHGLFTVEVGDGTPSTTETFLEIEWNSGPYYLEVSLDPAGGNSYSSMGTQQFLSVPYALHAGDDGDWLVVGDTMHNNGRRVGIGTTAPGATLHVEGTLQYDDGSAAEGLVLISDPNGMAAWGTLTPTALTGSGNTPTPDFSCLSTTGTLTVGTIPRSVAVSGNYAYVVDFGSDDLKVIDISTPSSPTIVGIENIGSLPTSIAVSGDHAYVVDQSSDDLKVIDISSPGTPFIIGSLPIGSSPTAVAVSGNYAYVVDGGSDDLKVIDISVPGTPTLAGSLPLGNNPTSITVSGNFAYVVDIGSADLKVIDISVPGTPTLTGSLPLGPDPRSITVSGNFAYVVDWVSEDLKVIDISTASTPFLVGDLPIGTQPNSVSVAGNYAYVVDVAIGDLKVIDVSTPDTPILVESLLFGTVPFSVTVSGNYAYVVDDGSDDLKVIQLACADVVSITFDGTISTHTIQPKWNTLDNDISNANSGNVGIGTTSPTAKLSVNGQANKPGGGSWSAFSDRRLKKDIAMYTDGLSSVLTIDPVKFKYNDLSGADTSKEYVGVIAQELEKVSPYMINTVDIDGTEYLEVDNSAMIYMLINSIKELHKVILEQNEMIVEQKDRLEEMASEIDANTDLIRAVQDYLHIAADASQTAIHGN